MGRDGDGATTAAPAFTIGHYVGLTETAVMGVGGTVGAVQAARGMIQLAPGASAVLAGGGHMVGTARIVLSAQGALGVAQNLAVAVYGTAMFAISVNGGGSSGSDPQVPGVGAQAVLPANSMHPVAGTWAAVEKNGTVYVHTMHNQASTMANGVVFGPVD